MSTCATCKFWSPPRSSYYPDGTCRRMQMDCYAKKDDKYGGLEDTPPTKRRRRNRKIDFLITWPVEEGPPIKALHLVVYTAAAFGCTEYVASRRRRKAPPMTGTPRRYLQLLED